MLDRTADNLNNTLTKAKQSKLKRSFLAERPQRQFILKTVFNDIPVSKADSQKGFKFKGLHLNSKLSFGIHVKTISTKINKAIGLLR